MSESNITWACLESWFSANELRLHVVRWRERVCVCAGLRRLRFMRFTAVFSCRLSLVLWSSLAIVCRSVKTTIKSESVHVGASERTWGGNTRSLKLHSITFRSSAQRSSRWPLTSSHGTREAHSHVFHLMLFFQFFLDVDVNHTDVFLSLFACFLAFTLCFKIVSYIL